MKVLLVGNYKFDGSMSMQVWTEALERELAESGIHVRAVRPRAFFGRLKPSVHGLGKWLGYIDRYAIFPLMLRWAARKVDVVHICDQGNAIYSRFTGGKPVVITCHDLLAVRGARGEETDCPASLFGRLLQKMVVHGLEHASSVACVSEYTYKDAQRILKRRSHLRVVLNGLNYPYRQLDTSEVERRLAGVPGTKERFVFHIGSNLPRKNREGVLRVYAQVARQSGLRMVFAGDSLNEALTALAVQLGIAKSIVNVRRPDVETVEALYNRAVVLLFPSRNEGFGWPPIEAQACGCPVVASNIPPIMEVLRDSAVIKPLDDEAGMAEAVMRIAADEPYREELRKRGYENVHTRFGLTRMIEEYSALYRELVCRS
jgi:glycosyltransferase involved in cell wall biosynthesis